MNISKEYNTYFTAFEKPEIVEIGQASYVSVRGQGSPGTAVFYQKKQAIKEFVHALELKYALTACSFTSRIVEIFYWFDEEERADVNIGNFYTTLDLSLLHYRIAIRIPDYITAENIVEIARNRKDIFMVEDFELFNYTAGTCVQIFHLGPFAEELQTLLVLQQFASDKGLKKSGMHHEIHLTNFEQGQSQQHLLTILRDPVIKQA